MNARLKVVLTILLMWGCAAASLAQADSVVIRVGKESKVIFLIKDKSDLQTMKHYNFQALMDDMLQKLEQRDTSALTKPSTEYLKDSLVKITPEKPSENWDRDRDRFDNYNDNDNTRSYYRRYKGRRTHHSLNIDLGMNNYLENGRFPDASNELYTVKPWGSWYVAVNSVLRTR